MKTVAKYITLTVIIIFPTLAKARAQDLGFFFNQSRSGIVMVESSVRQGIMLISQEYQLEDTLTHKRYSLDNQEYFGKLNTFAVLTDNGIITSPSMGIG